MDINTGASFCAQIKHKLILLFVQLVLSIPFLNAQVITTIAGGASGDGLQALALPLPFPEAVAMDTLGNLYIGQGNSIKMLNRSTGILTTVAGNVSAISATPDSINALQARILPRAFALDAAGNIFLAEDNRIRKINATTGIISTLTGNGTCGFAGDGGPAKAALICSPRAITLDRHGNIYFADQNSRIRKIDFTTGIITTVAGNGQWGWSGDGGKAINCSLFDTRALATDSSDNIYLAEYGSSTIRKITISTGNITTIAGKGTANIPTEGVLATNSYLYNPSGVYVDKYQNVFITEEGNMRVRKINAASGIINTVAGNGNYGPAVYGGSALQTPIRPAGSVVLDSLGNIFIPERNTHNISMVNAATGILESIAGNGTEGFYGDGVKATDAILFHCMDIAVDSASNLYIADWGNYRIRKVNASTGIIQTIAGTGVRGSLGNNIPAANAQVDAVGLMVDKDQNVYFSDAGGGSGGYTRKIDVATTYVQTIAGGGPAIGDNGPATAAALWFPYGLALDKLGNIFIADQYNQRIRKVTMPGGTINTIAGLGGTGAFLGDGGPANAAYLSYPRFPAFDKAGNLYFDNGGSRIRKIDAVSGIINTIAGNGGNNFSTDGLPALNTSLSVQGLAFDSLDNIYIADGYHRIKKISAVTGTVQTIAGNGVPDFSGDSLLAINSRVAAPSAIKTDRYGDVYFIDNGNKVRKISYPDRSIKTGNWNDPSIWGKGKVPDAFTQVTINHPIVVTANATAYSVTINSPANLLVNTGVQLIIIGH